MEAQCGLTPSYPCQVGCWLVTASSLLADFPQAVVTPPALRASQLCSCQLPVTLSVSSVLNEETQGADLVAQLPAALRLRSAVGPRSDCSARICTLSPMMCVWRVGTRGHPVRFLHGVYVRGTHSYVVCHNHGHMCPLKPKIKDSV